MSKGHKTVRKRLSEEEIDEVVVAQGDEDSAWEQPIQVRRETPAHLSIPADLAARAAFLAKLHRETEVVHWLTRIIRERIELEEVAFVQAKREMTPVAEPSDKT